MSAALTPRVRVLAVCDEAITSEIEPNVLTLEGVRHGFGAESFPCLRALNVYLMLSYARGGTFDGVATRGVIHVEVPPTSSHSRHDSARHRSGGARRGGGT